MLKVKNSPLIVCLLLFMLYPSPASSQSEGDEHADHFFFAVSAMASPAQTFVHFAEFREYLEEKLETHVHLKQRRSYEEINTLLYDASVQMAFTCTGGYLAGRKSFGLEVLAVPVVKGKTAYQSYIITGKNNPATTLEQLQGQVFAFTDPLSLSGRIYPVATLNSRGHMTKDFFKKTFYTESHDKSIEAVATGIADGAAVDSLIFDSLYKLSDSFATEINPELLVQLRSPEFRETFTELEMDLGEEFYNKDSVQLVDELAIEFAGLFIGPGHFISPHESVHRVRDDGDYGKLWGADTVAVKKFVEATGLSYQSDFGGMPDHIGAELEFMQKLEERYAQAVSDDETELADNLFSIKGRFLTEHLLAWAPEFFDKVINKANLPLYREVAELAKTFLEQEGELLQKQQQKDCVAA